MVEEPHKNSSESPNKRISAWTVPAVALLVFWIVVAILVVTIVFVALAVLMLVAIYTGGFSGGRMN